MVHRQRTPTRPSGLIDPKWDSLKASLLVEQHQHNISSKCYRDTTLKTLQYLYADKCAVCERKRGMELQVDHYRPFKPRNNKKNPHYNQPGYYWLAYTWSNLIPLCSTCNLAKSNKFPLLDPTTTQHVTSHQNVNNLPVFHPYDLNWLQQYEKPSLLHPELEQQPARHFMYTQKGQIRGRTIKGTATINICQLNRKQLKLDRKKIIQDYVTSIEKSVYKFSKEHRNSERFRGELEGIFESIKGRTHKDEAFSLLHLYICKYFDYFIGAFLPANANIRQKIVQYFESFILNR